MMTLGSVRTMEKSERGECQFDLCVAYTVTTIVDDSVSGRIRDRWQRDIESFQKSYEMLKK